MRKKIVVASGYEGASLPQPTPEQVRQARDLAGLSQAQAAQLVASSTTRTYRTWQNYETPKEFSGFRAIPMATWELFLLKVHQHPHFRLVENSLKHRHMTTEHTHPLDWTPFAPKMPGRYLWRECEGSAEHEIEVCYEQATSLEIGRFLRCYSLTDFGYVDERGDWAYLSENATPNCAQLDIPKLAKSQTGWRRGFPVEPGAYLWRHTPATVIARVDLVEATLLSGNRDQLVRNFVWSSKAAFDVIRTQGEWFRPVELNR